LDLRTTDGKTFHDNIALKILTPNREILREKIPPSLFFVFNVLFISLAQSLLLFAISTPTYVILLAAQNGTRMSGADIIFPRALMGLVLVEWFADGQQWSKSSLFLIRFV
jgi:hypothetical protein